VRRAVVVALIALAGCRDRPSAGASSREAPTPEGPGVELRVDGNKVGWLAAPATDLTAGLPAKRRDPATWTGLAAEAADGRTFHLADVAGDYPGGRVALLREPRGVVLAIYRAGGKAPALRFPGVASVDVETLPVVAPPPPAGVAVTLDGHAAPPIEDAELTRLATAPREHPRQNQGASLAPLVAARVPLAEVASVELDAGGGEILVVDGDALRSPEHKVLIRRNQRGVLRIKHTKGDAPVGDLRGLVALRITRRPAPAR
jgi:hypothetical protein